MRGGIWEYHNFSDSQVKPYLPFALPRSWAKSGTR
jgi:hypothetical protein